MSTAPRTREGLEGAPALLGPGHERLAAAVCAALTVLLGDSGTEVLAVAGDHGPTARLLLDDGEARWTVDVNPLRVPFDEL